MKLDTRSPDTTSDFDARFAALLEAWNSHQDRRFEGADIDALWVSHLRLDAARAAVGVR